MEHLQTENAVEDVDLFTYKYFAYANGPLLGIIYKHRMVAPLPINADIVMIVCRC